MNIAVVAADLIPNNLGGAEKHVVEIVKRLSKKHKILVFVGPNTAIQKEFSKNVTIIPVKYPKIPNFYGLAYIICGYPQLCKTISREKIDILWAKQSFPQAPLAVLVKHKFKIPLYTTVQNPMLHEEELVIKGKYFKPFHRIFTGLLTPIIKWSLGQSDLVAVVSKYSANKSKLMGAKKVIIIPNGINPKRFINLKGKKIRKLILVTTSSLIPRNGLDILIKAVALLPKTINWELKIAGEGPEYNSLELQISKLNLKKQIHLLGRIVNGKIPELLGQADIFIRPSRKEGFGISFIEAMAAGLPVIATPVGGITDFITHQETGILVKPDKPEEIAKAITSLNTNKKMYKKLQNQGRKLVIKRYNWNNIANEVEKALLSIY